MVIQKWYLSTWFISLCFLFSILILPFIAGLILLILQIVDRKSQVEKLKSSGIDKVQDAKMELEKLEAEIRLLKTKRESQISKLQILDDALIIDAKVTALELQKKELDSKLKQLSDTIVEKNNQIVQLDDEILYQSFGFYESRFNLETSVAYKIRLDAIRNEQKALVKAKLATNHSNNWTIDGNKKEGERMNNDNIKLTLYSFNTDCDNAISKLKFNNIDASVKRIKTSFDKLNKMNVRNRIVIKEDYLQLKLDELSLAYEYETMKQAEKEEQRQIKEQMREEEKVRREIEVVKQKIEKEEKHFSKEISSLSTRLIDANAEEKVALEAMIAELEEKLALVEKDKENVYQREQNTRAGYVYVISNIGSFGEDVYKIGMTRRLEPMDRVKELGDASVPFVFDVHAMIFSEDAPRLENELHRTFQERRVNRINERKEYFHVSLSEIEEVVRKNHNEVVEFTKVAEASDYRQTVMMNKEKDKVAVIA
jgi:Domain of unknown function (DUF4041)/Meiotically up-regulated gene 113